MDDLAVITQSIWTNFLTLWPYLLITIPLAVAVNLSGASRYINRAFRARPLTAIILATAVGAFSPFCSCGVIPVIATLLIGGVPLAPVMSFWIASPSMDPEIFFLSVAKLGPQLAIWRLGGTLALSLASGLATHWLFTTGRLGDKVLRDGYQANPRSIRQLSVDAARRARAALASWRMSPLSEASVLCCTGVQGSPAVLSIPLTATVAVAGLSDNRSSDETRCGDACSLRPSFRQRLWIETRAATWMVIKFMTLAFLLEALITLYVPETWIAGALGNQNPWAIWTAALLGVPLYTTNLTALPLVSALLAGGMNPAAGLAFLIAGPTTTLPAMAAVWGLVRPRVFAVYLLTALLGAVILGYVYHLTLMLGR